MPAIITFFYFDFYSLVSFTKNYCESTPQHLFPRHRTACLNPGTIPPHITTITAPGACCFNRRMRGCARVLHANRFSFLFAFFLPLPTGAYLVAHTLYRAEARAVMRSLYTQHDDCRRHCWCRRPEPNFFWLRLLARKVIRRDIGGQPLGASRIVVPHPLTSGTRDTHNLLALPSRNSTPQP